MEKQTQSLRRNNRILQPLINEIKKLIPCSDIMLLKIFGDRINLVTYAGDYPQVDALSVTYGPESLTDPELLNQDHPKIVTKTVFDIKIEETTRILYGGKYRGPWEKITNSLVIPVKSAEGNRFILVVSTREDIQYSPQDLADTAQLVLSNVFTIENAAGFGDALLKGVLAEELLTMQHEISKHHSEDVINQLIVDQACNLCFAETALLFLKKGNNLSVAASSGTAVPGLEPGLTVQSGEIQQNKIKSLLGDSCLTTFLPAQSGPIGVLAVVNKKMGVFDENDVRSIEMLSSAASIGLENINLLEQISQISVLEERERLAHEFHDSLGQSISYLKMQSSLIRKHVSEGKCTQAVEELTQHSLSLDDTFLMVRMAIFNLRFPLDEDTDFVTTMQKYLKEFSSRSGIQGTFNANFQTAPFISLDIKLQLIRIFQEALSNVRRHANAGKINVQVTRRSNNIVIEIVDDGKGFMVEELKHRGKDHYGLQIMQERAKSFGGMVTITSIPGTGTTVKVEAPEEIKDSTK